MWRRFGRVLLILQTGLLAVCVYGIVHSYTAPYKSEWLTADAFVPYYLLAMLILGFGMFLTWLLIRRRD